ncbi:phosphoinositide-3-kinase-interacting protein 1-like [Denticeps clupeoides]|uniref:phosphoinositide-3-kinase-interacting protein 1-like n=1 Tax=Denticeps clupeoides TaxID=299321 RepID=UPI0010A4C279|nr:phosphoinositide-3-kinase-interacting protein 1-like [Denticeps clupeoides]
MIFHEPFFLLITFLVSFWSFSVGEKWQNSTIAYNVSEYHKDPLVAGTELFPSLSSGDGRTEQMDAPPAQKESTAVKPELDIRWGGGTGPRGERNLGLLGHVLGLVLMITIILLGSGISLGYLYHKGCKLKLQRERRAYEQEMHIINLPLSAFSNPVYEAEDESCTAISIEETLLDMNRTDSGMGDDEETMDK